MLNIHNQANNTSDAKKFSSVHCILANNVVWEKNSKTPALVLNVYLVNFNHFYNFEMHVTLPALQNIA